MVHLLPHEPIICTDAQTGGLSLRSMAELNALTFLERALMTFPLLYCCDVLGRRPVLMCAHAVAAIAFTMLASSFK